MFEKHGTTKRRAWRKLHIGIDADSGEIVASDLTDKDVDDASHVEPLLDQLNAAPASFMDARPSYLLKLIVVCLLGIRSKRRPAPLFSRYFYRPV